MARKRKSAPPADSSPVGRYHIENTADWGGFINIRVNDDMRSVFTSWWGEHRTECWQALDDLMGEGMKVSLSYDNDNQCYSCAFTGRGWESSTKRWCMTTKAGTLDEVIALALWKHFELANGNWGDYRPDGTKKEVWG